MNALRPTSDFDYFVAQNATKLLQTAYLMVWDHHEAEDLTQECLFRVARRWPRIRRMDHPSAYAQRVLVNLTRDELRDRARRPHVSTGPDLTGDYEAGDDPPVSADRLDVMEALRSLPFRQRAVLVLRYFNDMSERQIAEVLGCSQGTVKSSASHGLARLRETLSDFDTQVRSGSE